ncbi:hypothetical protein MKW98_027442 [Papaver atlanticum]|uniref:Uncharacterized protein n=1 Tax=Papaver atlanticum TaxID=357466 RepID=A0AAD4TH68_9MAGN|nr:hypothetical protein MKW98_027442 [Papaver atlanticum]
MEGNGNNGCGRRNTEGRGRGRGRGHRRGENFVKDYVQESNSRIVGSRSHSEDETRSTSGSRYNWTRSTRGSRSVPNEGSEGRTNSMTLENLQTMMNTAITAALDQSLGPCRGTKTMEPPGSNAPVTLERNTKS